MFHVLAIPEFLTDNLLWLVGGLIVAGGLLFGLGDVLRFSGTRIWAISSVGFDESMRKRVLLITPLAILGVIVVAQLQHPVDAQDAIRQTIKVSLFATGVVVVTATIIMACTNLPKEIESRVIFTVVTKPTTRLEIIIGKIVGFARVSGVLLLIMGIFTWGYVSLRAWNYHRDIVSMLASDTKMDESGRASMQYYAAKGLTAARRYESPRGLAIVARTPKPGDDVRWVFGSGEQDILVPFDAAPEQLIATENDTINTQRNSILRLALQWEQRELTPEEKKASQQDLIPDYTGVATTTTGGPLTPEAAKAAGGRGAPDIRIMFLDANQNSLVPPTMINGGKPISLPAEKGKSLDVPISGEVLGFLGRAGKFYVSIAGTSLGTTYGIKVNESGENSPVKLLVAAAKEGEYLPVMPLDGSQYHFRGRLGMSGQDLRGGPEGTAPVAVYSFRGAEINANEQGKVAFEVTVSIEKGGDDPTDADIPTQLSLSVMEAKTGVVHGSIDMNPESRRTTHLDVPADWLGGGDFDVLLREKTLTHWAGLTSKSVAMVEKNEPFVLNLGKSLLIMWMLSVLVIAVSIFASTFVSWPIAIVLTLVILLGKWGVDELGDATTPGIGNQVATDMGFRDPALAKVTSTSVEALSRFLNAVSSVLPDIGAFGGTDEVEEGVVIPTAELVEAIKVLLAFGVPLTVLSYVFLKNKEVAP